MTSILLKKLSELLFDRILGGLAGCFLEMINIVKIKMLMSSRRLQVKCLNLFDRDELSVLKLLFNGYCDGDYFEYGNPVVEELFVRGYLLRTPIIKPSLNGRFYQKYTLKPWFKKLIDKNLDLFNELTRELESEV